MGTPRLGGASLLVHEPLANEHLPGKGGGVLVQDDLVARRRALSGGDGGPGQEHGPETEPVLAVLADDQILVGKPVVVPLVDGS